MEVAKIVAQKFFEIRFDCFADILVGLIIASCYLFKQYRFP